MSVLKREKCGFYRSRKTATVTRKRLYPTYPPWEELMQDVGKIKLTMNPEKKTLERTWQWLNVAVSPSLKLMDKIGKLDNRDYIRQLIERGQMNEEQQRIYEDYKNLSFEGRRRRIFDRTYTEHDTDKESLTVNEASEYTGIGRNNLRKLITWQKIPVIRIGNKILIRSEVLDQFFEEKQERGII